MKLLARLRTHGVVAAVCGAALASTVSPAAAADPVDWRDRASVLWHVVDQGSCQDSVGVAVATTMEARDEMWGNGADLYVHVPPSLPTPFARNVDAAGSPACAQLSAQATKTFSTYRRWYRLPSDDASVLSALRSHGPLLTTISVTRAFKTYTGGILDPGFCPKYGLRQAVVIVGYGEENGHPYFTVKNSWGKGWGEGGFARIAYGHNTCGIADDVRALG